mgnify:CR=1 FL=1
MNDALKRTANRRQFLAGAGAAGAAGAAAVAPAATALGTTRLFGVTRWSDYLIVKGLAAETRRHTRHEQHHAESGHFTWLIA